MVRRLGSVAAVLIALLLPMLAAAQGQLQTFQKAELAIASASGKHRFTVELALTPEQMSQGLMFRRQLAPDAGMLFDYGRNQPASFWMKNTLIPLDMLFIAGDGKIAAIHERAVPLSLEPITSPVPVRAVLELNGGTASRLGLKPGDRVISATLGTAGGQ
jgi:uncharacterized membrane protein (UPF0127 family)